MPPATEQDDHRYVKRSVRVAARARAALPAPTAVPAMALVLVLARQAMMRVMRSAVAGPMVAAVVLLVLLLLVFPSSSLASACAQF
jgi:amino acid permease